jgi:hypothetical protein
LNIGAGKLSDFGPARAIARSVDPKEWPRKFDTKAVITTPFKIAVSGFGIVVELTFIEAAKVCALIAFYVPPTTSDPPTIVEI